MATVSYNKVSKAVRDVIVKELTLRVPGKVLLEDTDLKIAWGRRYALLANNGLGKSVLLKSLADGSIPTPSTMSTYLVSQELMVTGASCIDYVMQSDDRHKRLSEREAELEGRLGEASEEEMDVLLHELEDVSERLRQLASNSAMSHKILHGLGFNKNMMQNSAESLSGGYKMRLSLARALFIQPDLLLLDEPSNHLDVRSIIWLSMWLQNWKKTLVIVTHDRALVDAVATDMLLINFQKLRHFRGTYDDMLNSLKAEKPLDPPEFHFDFGDCPFEVPPSASISVSDVFFGYQKDKPLLQEIDLCLTTKSHVAVVGRNGSGKTSVFKLLCQQLEPWTGAISIHKKLRIAYFGQHSVDDLHGQQTAIDYLRSRRDIGLTDVHKALSLFGLAKSERVRELTHLSGGQRTRVMLTDIFLQKPHILILDEISNHLDMGSIDALAEAIEAFAGGVIVSSHNQQLLKKITDESSSSEVWELDDGRLWKYEGSFDQYVRQIEQQIARE